METAKFGFAGLTATSRVFGNTTRSMSSIGIAPRSASSSPRSFAALGGPTEARQMPYSPAPGACLRDGTVYTTRILQDQLLTVFKSPACQLKERRGNQRFKTSTSVLPSRAGDGETQMPAASIAA